MTKAPSGNNGGIQDEICSFGQKRFGHDDETQGVWGKHSIFSFLGLPLLFFENACLTDTGFAMLLGPITLPGWSLLQPIELNTMGNACILYRTIIQLGGSQTDMEHPC